jgi:hypothetical protein
VRIQTSRSSSVVRIIGTVDVSARHAFYDIVKKRRGPSVRRKASEFEIIKVMSELNQNGYRLIVQRVAPWWLFTSDGQAASGGKGRLDALRSDGI